MISSALGRAPQQGVSNSGALVVEDENDGWKYLSPGGIRPGSIPMPTGQVGSGITAGLPSAGGGVW